MNVHIYNMYKYKDLFFELVKKNIKLKYRNSILGVFWSMVNPIVMTFILSIIFMSLFENEIPYYTLYVLIGRILYQYFSESTNFALEAISANSQLLRKIYVPKYFFPLSRACSSLITSLVSMVPLVVVMVISGVSFRWINLFCVIPLFYLFMISSSIGLLLSSISVFFKDVKHFHSVMLLILMYLTPIFYPTSIIPEKYMPLVLVNPLFPIVEIFRDFVIYGTSSDPLYHWLSIIHVIVYFMLGFIVFYKTQDRFIYHL